MKSTHLLLSIAALCASIVLPASAKPVVLVPESSGYKASDAGKIAHTALRVLSFSDAKSASSTSNYNTPATIRAVYNFPTTFGGSNAIAIVDAYDYPTALNDFNVFSTNFGLPTESSTVATASTNTQFQVVYATGTKPASGGNYIGSWNLEAALDIEWSHAMAPNAKIILVEAASAATTDLYYGVQVAGLQTGVKEVSMSWGGGETPTEVSSYDSYFADPGIVYFASGGDSSALEYPSTSKNVVSCGGTTLNRNGQGVFLSETGWSDTGCGDSLYEPRPSFQSSIVSIVGSKRGVDDLSFEADPNTGVYVYDSTIYEGESGYYIVGGTSVSSPSLAGVINSAATAGSGFATSSANENARIYHNLGVAKNFRDITVGTDGKFTCAVGWDYITGVGSPLGYNGK